MDVSNLMKLAAEADRRNAASNSAHAAWKADPTPEHYADLLVTTAAFTSACYCLTELPLVL
jgi:hypothetical protein